MFERLDAAAQAVLHAAYREALAMGDSAIGTEHLLIALATTDAGTARLLSDAGCDADHLPTAIAPRGRRTDPPRDHAALLARLGIDLATIRSQAERTFGSSAVARAASAARPPAPRRSLWSRISCSTPQPRRRCDSPLAGNQLGMIPRVKRLLQRASDDARPGRVTPSRLLLTLLDGNEPACEQLLALGVDVDALAAQLRRDLDAGNNTRRRVG
jgi:ATP-dependent Clp protease ATP-binding subunit ClpA